MNQEKIGKFIAECRKKQGLTQQELADKLNLTYKAISKWECGKGLPNVTLYEPLCKILKISLNEFFAGQLLEEEEVLKSSERNILKIAVEEKKSRTRLNQVIVLSLIVIIALVGVVFDFYTYMSEYMNVAKTFELNWGIVLPSDFKEEYAVNTGVSFHGDGERYSVYSGMSFLTSLEDSKNELLEEEVNNLYNALNISEEYRINFAHQYSWKKIYQKDDERNYLYCIFDEETKRFYFYENIF